MLMLQCLCDIVDSVSVSATPPLLLQHIRFQYVIISTYITSDILLQTWHLHRKMLGVPN